MEVVLLDVRSHEPSIACLLISFALVHITGAYIFHPVIFPSVVWCWSASQYS